MKKLPMLILFIMILGLSSAIASQKNTKNANGQIASQLETKLSQNFNNRGINADVSVNVLEPVKEMPGYYFVRVNIKDHVKNASVKQFYITNGQVLIPAAIVFPTGENIVENLKIEHNTVEIDVNKFDLALLKGHKGAKNTIIVISDFQCPYCRQSKSVIENLFQKYSNKDLAIYMMHFPLNIHQKAVIFAKIFEAGKSLGYDFASDIMSGKYDNMEDKQIIEEFKKKIDANKQSEFEKLVNSEKIAQKIERQAKEVEKNNINGTPSFVINGRLVQGMNPQTLDIVMSKLLK